MQNNLLYKYASAVAPFEVRSLKQLADICRRFDTVSGNQSRFPQYLPFQLNSNINEPNRMFRSFHQSRVNTVDFDLNKASINESIATTQNSESNGANPFSPVQASTIDTSKRSNN